MEYSEKSLAPCIDIPARLRPTSRTTSLDQLRMGIVSSSQNSFILPAWHSKVRHTMHTLITPASHQVMPRERRIGRSTENTMPRSQGNDHSAQENEGNDQDVDNDDSDQPLLSHISSTPDTSCPQRDSNLTRLGKFRAYYLGAVCCIGGFLCSISPQ